MPLEQHPVPQEISSYEFRLVGDMTLKQFLQLAGGVGIAFLIFVTPLPAFIKWPFILFAGLAGAALAFLPFEERPLSFWVFSFLKAIYSPTLYVWQANAAENVYVKEHTAITPVLITPQGEQKAEEYLHSLPQPAEVAPFEENEKGFFNEVSSLFQQTTHPGNQPKPIAPPETMPAATHTPQPMTPVFAPNSTQSTPQTSQALFSLEASPPNPPVQPNIIVGQVVTSGGKIVESAILEVREVGGHPVRALRTNKIGHFLTVTPIRDGEYEIETEKEGLSFDTVRVQAIGNIIPPILIKAK